VIGRTGDDTVQGGSGSSDAIKFTGENSHNAVYTPHGSETTITFTDNPGQSISVTGVEELIFTDKTVPI